MKRWLTPLTGALLLTLGCGETRPAEVPTAQSPPAEPPPNEAHSPAASPQAEAPQHERADHAAAAGSAEGADNEFVLRDSKGAKDAHGASPSKIRGTATEAALKFVVVDRDTGPIEGIVIALTDPSGRKYYTPETDAQGYTEVLVPVGAQYELVYLSLGSQDITAKVTVSDEPRQNIRLTLRYKSYKPPAAGGAGGGNERFVLTGVTFDTGKAKVRPESFARLDSVVEYLTHKKSARIEISGHTDSIGNPQTNKALSLRRAQACRDYLISKGVEASRIQAVGYGDERPVASNDTEAGRQQNRRIEVTEL